MKIFEPKSSKFNRYHALATAQAAALVYEDWDKVEKEVKKEGYNQFCYFDCEGTQAFLAGNDDTLLLSFRGTEPDKLEDIMTDLDINFVDGPFGRVHDGFNRALNCIIRDVVEKVKFYRKSNQSLFVTGHSLGAALATLAFAYLEKEGISTDALYTFGQPRVGNEEFAQGFNLKFKEKAYRIVNNNDIVTRVPMRIMGYSHVGTHFYFDSEGNLHEDPKLSWWFKFTDSIKGNIEDFGKSGPDNINDHNMLEYLGLLKNQLHTKAA